MHKTLIYSLFSGDRLTHWHDVLCTQAGLAADPAERLEIDFFDSFDWRLHAAGKRLEAVHHAHGDELRLLRLDNDQVEAVLPVDGRTLRFPSALPESELRSQLKGLLEMRALLPLATLRVRCYPLREVDDEGKTRARVSLEAVSLVDAAGKRRLLQKRICLQPLRGYNKSAKRISNILEQTFHLQAVDDELFSRALAAAGKQPGDYSGKLDIHLQDSQRADAAVRRVLVELFAAMQANEAGTIADLDSEFLHDFRVAVRRTRSMLGQLKHVFPPATLQRFTREFRWVGALTSTVRDLDVYLLKFETYQAAIAPELRSDLETLRTFLQYKQRIEHAQLAAWLQGARYRALKRQWQRYLTSPLPKRPSARDAAKPVGAVAHHRTWRMYKRVLREGRAINADAPPAELHELRKSCKKLRYLMEFFQSLYPPGKLRASIRELKQLQDNLGDFQDLDVQLSSLRRFAMEMRRRGEYSAATGKAMDALLQTLEGRMRQARDEFEARFQRFAETANQARFRKLFEPAAQSDAE
jgi:CHAD domain-containing protein